MRFPSFPRPDPSDPAHDSQPGDRPEAPPVPPRRAPRGDVSVRAASPWWRAPWSIALCLALALACGEGGSTDPSSPPAELLALSPAVDTVVTGDATDPPITVRVQDALGEPVEGIPVRFRLDAGEGELSPSLAVSNQEGIAEAGFRAGVTPGEVRIHVDVPSVSNVPVLEFTVVAAPSDSVALRIVEGDAQRAEVGSQLPIPFVVQAVTPAGTPAGGIAIAWRITDGSGRSALLTADTTFTDGAGRGSALLTLGRDAAEYGVEAFATRGVLSDTVRFSATATARFEGAVRLDSVRPVPLVAGSEGTVYGRGFSPIPSENDVRIEGRSARILEAGGSALRIEVPAFGERCLPAREVGVRALVAGDASNGEMIALQPTPPPLDLQVGEARTARGDESRCLQFPASEAPREYRIAVGSAAPTAGSALALRLAGRVADDPTGGRFSARVGRAELDAGVQQEARLAARPDALIRQRALAALRRARVGPAAGAARPAAAPVRGDSARYVFAVRPDLTASCTDTTEVIRGVVRAVRDHVVLVEDPRASSGGGFAPDQWAALAEQLDRLVVPVDTAYFGAPADLDGNGRVVLLFSPAVNELATAGAADVHGFFHPMDLAASGRRPSADGGAVETCPASNEAEILYLAVPDPEGEFGRPTVREEVSRRVPSIVAHELQHLINAESRVLRAESGFGATEEAWLDEALSGIAEEAVGLASLELGERGDYTFEDVTGSREALRTVETFLADNFFRLSLFLSDPAGTAALAAEDPGEVEGLQMRGFGWFLLRWLADHSGGDARPFFRALVTGGQNQLRGIENLEQASGRRWEEMQADFAVALAADDTGVEALDTRHRILTWNFRDVFAGLSRTPAFRSRFPTPFPLRPTTLGFETGTLDFVVGTSTVRYFALVSGLDSPALALTLSSSDARSRGETTRPYVTIVRTR